MSEIENLLYSAYEYGKRQEVLDQVGKLRKDPNRQGKSLEELYQEAYEKCAIIKKYSDFLYIESQEITKVY